MLVDEVEPEKMRIANTGEQMPRRSDHKKSTVPVKRRNSRQRRHSPLISRKAEGESHDDDSQQSLGEHRQRNTSVGAVPAPGIAVFQSGGEEIKR